MSNKMLIDASHQEETRVVVVRGNRIEEFDFESEHKKQLKGNIYLARVTRVEPSLQAAFVEYGGNRHGFLAFSEIHPDYYQIPVADRIALLEAEAQAASEEDEDDEGNGGRSERGGDKARRGKRRGRRSRSEDEGLKAEDGEDSAPYEASSDEENDDGPEGTTIAAAVEGDVISEDIPDSADLAEDEADTSDEAPSSRERAKRPSSRRRRKDADDDNDGSQDESDIVESVGAEDALEEVPTHQRTQRRQYKIQEVVKRRQILLVQVVKEERGNKGAALTTYLSLAGRYSVLMPNTARGGGISRKITSPVDRKRLKEIVKELEVPKGMGVILRTAGANRTKAEVKRDYEYLMRLWENVRALTLQSTAPALVYEEGSLIKRSIRDLYNKDIGEIQVAGEDGYREAKDFMRMLMPSHAKVVQPYRDPVPIFARNGIEAQLDRMLQPQVTLKSGGYIIINQTEALVAIDVNSGRSTREHSIEDTALQTNLEAAEEVARQLRLRDLAGLVVIDFIDMEEKRNNRAVEKRMKDCLKDDRARIQVGRISHFGLLEMSRQRIRASVLESTMQVCAHCGGTGYIRSASSVALHVIRSIEEYLLRHSQNNIIVRTPVSTALYVLNHKRKNLADLELRFGLTIDIEADDSVGSQHLAIDKGTPALGPVSPAPVTLPYPDLTIDEEPLDEPDIPVEDEEFEADDISVAKDEHSDESGRKRRRRRRRRGGRDRDGQENAVAADAASGDERVVGEAGDTSQEDGEQTDLSAEAAEEERRKKRRRGRRGGRKNRRNDDEANDNIEASSDDEARSETDEGETAPVADLTPVPDEVPAAPLPAAEEDAEAAATVEGKPVKKPVRRRTPRAKPVEEAVAEAVEDLDAPLAEEPAPQEKPAKPARKSRKKVVPAAEAPEAVESDVTAEAPRSEEKPEEKAEETPAPTEPAATPPEPSKPVVTSNSAEEKPKPKRAGWWQKKGFF